MYFTLDSSVCSLLISFPSIHRTFILSLLHSFRLIRNVESAVCECIFGCLLVRLFFAFLFLFFSFHFLWLIHSNFNAMHTRSRNTLHYMLNLFFHVQQMVLHKREKTTHRVRFTLRVFLLFPSFLTLAKCDCVFFSTLQFY